MLYASEFEILVRLILPSLCYSPTPSYRWVKITEANDIEDVSETADIKFGTFQHRLTIYNINKRHNGTYRCIATIKNGNETKVDTVQGRIIVRGMSEGLD